MGYISEIIVHTARAAEEAVHATESSGGVTAMFGISWKLFIAQLVNFTIVLVVLWKWVFTPVTQALQKRTAKIEDALKHAEQVEKEKAAFTQWKKQEIAKARSEAGEIITLAKTEAETVRHTILTTAKTEQEQLVSKGKAELEHEKVRMLQKARGDLAELVVAATEAVLREKLSDKKDAELVRRVLEKI